jgi:hypothetical protein
VFDVGMDVVFDTVDRALETVRRRWPVVLLAVGGILWVLATAAVVGATILMGARITALVLVALPTALLIVVAVRGLDRTRWPIWPWGVALPVFLAGLVPPQAPRFEETFDWLVPILVFVYAQVFLAVVTAGDELYRRRTSTPGPDQEVPAMSDFGERRILQTKLLVATLVIIGTSQAALDLGADNYAGDNQVGQSSFEYGISCVAVPMLVGVWWRLRGLAWYAVVVLPAVFALSLLPRTPEARWEAVLTQGWIVVAAAWQWGKAARKPFWPHPRTEPVPPPLPPAVPWMPGVHYPDGAVVTFYGVLYRCRLGHTSLPAWAPPNTLSLWWPL